MRRFIFVWALVALFLVPAVHAQPERDTINVSTLGPQVGEHVPEFSLPDQNGKLWTRDSIMGPDGAMILFHRSADW